VTLKPSGLRIVRLSSGPERTRRAILAETREMIDGMEANGRPVVGFAMVMWDCDGSSDAACRAYPGSNIPSIAIPDFARNRLLARKIGEWSKC
jgi:sorbitol-specific phosphotransferase system component IIBC